MLNDITRTYKAEGHDINVVEVSIYYSKGGMNYFTYRNEPRGYYFSIQPYLDSDLGNGVTGRMFRAFSGMKDCVLPCERQSKKRYETAKAMMDDLVNEYLDSWCKGNNVTLLSDEYEVKECERK